MTIYGEDRNERWSRVCKPVKQFPACTEGEWTVEPLPLTVNVRKIKYEQGATPCYPYDRFLKADDFSSDGTRALNEAVSS